MDKHRFPALVLAGALTLSLAACGGKDSPTPAPTDTPAVSGTPAAVESAQPSVEPTESAEPAPTPTETVEAEPAESDAAAPAPGTVQVSPIVTPAPSVEPSAEPSALTAADVYAAVSEKAGGSSMIDASLALTEYFNVSEDDLEDYALYVPDMSANIEEIFIAKAKSGKLDAVKAACESRLQGLREQAEFYPATGAYLDSYKLTTNGDWVLFCVCENPDSAVTAFNDCTK